jgi:hypothetical protein
MAEACCGGRITACPGFVEFIPCCGPVEFTESWCGLLELVGAVNPILGGCFGECVLKDAGAEMIDIDIDHRSHHPANSAIRALCAPTSMSGLQPWASGRSMPTLPQRMQQEPAGPRAMSLSVGCSRMKATPDAPTAKVSGAGPPPTGPVLSLRSGIVATACLACPAGFGAVERHTRVMRFSGGLGGFSACLRRKGAVGIDELFEPGHVGGPTGRGSRCPVFGVSPRFKRGQLASKAARGGRKRCFQEWLLDPLLLAGGKGRIGAS